MGNLQIGQTLYVIAPNKKSLWQVEIINIKKEYEKEVFPERYLTITTKADAGINKALYNKTIVGSGIVDFFPEDFGKIIFTSVEEVKEHILNKDIDDVDRYPM